MSKLRCKDFTVQYFGYDASISGITTEFVPGINVVFAREKGGKTTFLKALAGIVPYTGELFFDDEDLSSVPLEERDFQMLFDDYALFERRSVRYNLEYPLKLRNIPKEERHRRVEEVAELFDLNIMIDAPVYRLNEWLKVSLVLCRAYLRNARVLLIDNIFSKLDLSSRKEAFYRYLPLLRSEIVIYATDSVKEAAALSNKIKFISYGYLLQEGKVEDFVSYPLSISAFSTFGEYVSLIPCILKNDGVLAFGTDFSLTIPKLFSDSYLGKEVVVGATLDDLCFSDNGFDAKVTARFYQKDRFVYALEKDGCPLYVRSEKEIPLDREATVAIKGLTAVFDIINQRTLVKD